MLTGLQIEDYERDGFLKIRELISSTTVATLREEIARVTASPPPELVMSHEPTSSPSGSASSSKSPLRKVRNIAPHSEPIFNFCTSPPMIRVAEDILGSAIGFYGDQVLFKTAVTGSAKPLHQDIAYFRTKPPEAVITFWCSLNKADESNGCMHYIPGSHKNGIADHTKLQDTPHLVADSHTNGLVAVPTLKGDCIIHSSLTLHMTPPNLSDRPRMAFLAHYVRLDAEFPPRSSHATPIVPIPSHS